MFPVGRRPPTGGHIIDEGTMSALAKPAVKPVSALFSSGPTRKRPGWSPSVLANAATGRSHRAKAALSHIQDTLTGMRELLGLPDDYRIGIVPASDTGAVEMAMWSLLGARGVDVVAWESFGRAWVSDAVNQLKVEPLNVIEADYGDLPDLTKINFDHDVIFTWNGTTSGVRVADGDWIPADRGGLTIADSTSACFAMEMPWDKLDVVTFSFQKALGGEGGHGVIILSPRAVERANSHSPTWPVPKVLSLHKKGKLDEALFTGSTINTPSLLVIEDALDTINWAKSIGGLPALIARVNANLAAVDAFVTGSPNFDFLANVAATRSPTSICLKISDDWFTAQDKAAQKAIVTAMQGLLADEQVALDIGSYRDAPLGLRIWGGPTVDPEDTIALMPWLDWAYLTIRTQFQNEAA